MQTKNILVSFLTIVSVLFLVSTVTAAGYKIDRVDVNGVTIDVSTLTSNTVPITAGETAKVEVWFTGVFNRTYDTDVTVEAEIDTGKDRANAISQAMVIEKGDQRKVTLNVDVPYELNDALSNKAKLTIDINGKYFDFTQEYTLKTERPAYQVELKSVSISQTITAGESFPVDIVMSNIGYNDLKDLYVTARIPALKIETSSYFGDLVALECGDHSKDDTVNHCRDHTDITDTVSGRLLMNLPYDAPAGVYTLELEISNDDLTRTAVKQFIVTNDFSNPVIVSSYKKTAAVGVDAEYEMLIVNPTNNVKVYRIVTESSGDLTSSAKETIVAVPAGSSKSVTIVASAKAEGDYNFDVSVFSGEKLVDTVTLNLTAQGKSTTTDLTVILTVILAIVFIVLLVVLIVLIGKKPTKTEEFGESYY